MPVLALATWATTSMAILLLAAMLPGLREVAMPGAIPGGLNGGQLRHLGMGSVNISQRAKKHLDRYHFASIVVAGSCVLVGVG